MADARGRCQQRLSPHHPRGACGCLICGEDDHRWTCCGKSYLSAGCTNGEDLIGARATGLIQESSTQPPQIWLSSWE